MISNHKFKKTLIVLILAATFFNAMGQIRPMLNCFVTSISPTTVNAGSGAGQVNPTITVNTSPSSCTTYLISNSYSWIHYTQNVGNIVISVDANTGAARTGSLNIGGQFLTVNQACGNTPVAPTRLTVNRNNFCSNSGGDITLSVVGGSGTSVRWFTGDCGGTQVGYTDGPLTITAPTATTRYWARWENSCTYSSCKYITVNVITVGTPSVSGTASVCAGSTYNYSVTPVSGATSYTWTIPLGASGSSTSESINVTFGTNSGSVSAVANSSGGCTSLPGSLSVNVGYLYPYIVTGGGTTCPGIGIPVGLQGSTNGTTYKLYLNGSWQSGDMIVGNGGSNVSWNKSAPGTYTIMAVSGTCEVPMSGSVSIANNIQSSDPVSINATTNPICLGGAGTTLTVNGGNPGTGASWKWYTGGCGTTLVYTGNSFPVNPSSTTTYWVRAEGTCNATACAAITVNVSTPPTITQQPQSQTICAGAAVSFNVSASGAISYQWQNKIGGIWSDIPGATGTTYSISNTTGMDGRGYKCIVTGPCSFSTATNEAYIIFSYLYPYTIRSANTTICPGAANEITLNGSSPDTRINYYCYHDGSILYPPVHGDGSGGPISFGNHSLAGVYTVKAANLDGCVVPMSGSVTVTVKTPSTPATSIDATLNNICPGTGTSLTLSGGSLETGAGVWHWYSGEDPCGSTPEGQGTTNITVHPTVTTTYYVRAEGGCVTTSCVKKTIVVLPPLSITNQPVNMTIALNQDASFSVTAIGGTLQYLWQSSINGVDSWTDLTGYPAEGYQTSTLTIKGSSSFEDRYYRCMIGSSCGGPLIYSDSVKILLSFPSANYLFGTDIPDPETRALNTSSYLVGSTNGGVSINPMGGSAYNISLEVPPGINGLTPNLSLSYSSNSGSGIAGFGWQIGGISSISLGARLPYIDYLGNDNFDRFYLDGQRLACTKDSYGVSSALYQTENDIFTRITPETTIMPYGPKWFKAETKTGLVYEYGYSPSSRLRISENSKALNWYVSRIKDLYGNTVDFNYIQDHYTIYPSEIKYGPNTITFYYRQRLDKNVSLVSGIHIEQSLLLDKIVIKYNSSIIKTYEFKYSYQGSSYNLNSILNEVIEYGLGSARLNSTVFSYQMPQNVSFPNNPDNKPHDFVTYKSKLFTGDFNGDGKADFLCLPDSIKGAIWTGMRVFFGDGADNFTTAFSSSVRIDQTRLRDLRIMDLNQDGVDDILYEYGQTSTSPTSYFNYIICNGISFSQPVSFLTQTSNLHTGMTGKYRRNGYFQEDDNEHVYRNSLGKLNLSSLYPAKTKNMLDTDFNGDGINDVFINDPDGNCHAFSYSSGQMTCFFDHSYLYGVLDSDVLSGDFDGDGLIELWSFQDSGLKIYKYDYTAIGQIRGIFSSDWPTNHHYFALGDFNADGKTDMFLYGYKDSDGVEYDWPDWQIQLSTGSGFEKHEVPQKKANLKNDYVRTGDFNGDGANDIMVTAQNLSWSGTKFYISGDDGTNLYYESLPGYPVATNSYYLADFNGDGRTDFICTDGVSPWWDGYQVFKSAGNTSILLDKMANGLGVLTKLSYTKLSQAPSTVYTRGSGASFPVMEFQGPWSVVSSVQSDNGKGSLNTQNYYYEGAKIHLKGKGFIGYAKTRVTDVTSGLEKQVISGYNTAYYYPKVLMTLSKLTGVNDTIEKVTNLWDQVILDDTQQRIFPYIKSSSEVNKLIGHSVTTNSQFDSYGNPVLITKRYLNGPVEKDSINYENTITTSKWLLGRPVSTTIKFTDSDTIIIRAGTRVFDTDNNHLTIETWYSGTTNEITKSYGYTPNGSLKKETLTAGTNSRTNKFTYESDSIRIHSTTDPLYHTLTNAYDNFGRLHTQQDYLGNIITYQYDALGRQSVVSSSDGSQKTTNFNWHDPQTDPVPALYSVVLTGNDGSLDQSWYDKLGRIIRSDKKGFSGTMIHSSTVYNTKGQVESVTEPYYSNDTPLLNTFIYDDYGRKDISFTSFRNEFDMGL